ncbi:MAG: ABC transporter substrate-binding protein [Flavobacteriaceae bacterium]|nr:ABC transporter substrate-binding protein [Flavobacteriaceae bacterium]MDG2387478.1 ABC transporter substrate-binding protein [Flavobacteriaceae bacterium]
MFKKTFTVFTIVFATLFVIMGCNPNETIDPKQVFRYNEYRNVTSLDPAFARNPQNIWPVNQLFNGLVQLDNQLQIKPEIATQWNLSEDGLTYTFYLRDDVYFHNSPLFGKAGTRTVRASDFVYSFDRLTDPKVASPGSWVMQQVASYKALSDHTFEVQLKNPFPGFLGLLSMRYCAVVPKEVVEHYGNQFRSNPIGTGPFYFKRWEENIKLVLRKNTHYFEKDLEGNSLPYLEAIAIQFIPDIQSEFMLFLQGKLDFINSLDSSYKDELLTPTGSLQPNYKNRLKLLNGPYLNTEYIGIYLDNPNPAIQSLKIREALNIGFDRKLMIAYLRNNIGYPARKGFIPKGLSGSSQEALIYDPKKARALVKSFIEETQTIPKLTLTTDANYLDLCEYLQHEMQKIGVEIQVEVMPTATLRQAKSSGKLELFRASWIADYPDAENYLSLFYSKNFSPNGPNYTHFKDEEYDSLYNQAMTTPNDTLRIQKYLQMDRLVMENYPVVPLYYDEVVRFVQRNIKGMEINPINLLILKNVSKE